LRVSDISLSNLTLQLIKDTRLDDIALLFASYRHVVGGVRIRPGRTDSSALDTRRRFAEISSRHLLTEANLLFACPWADRGTALGMFKQLNLT
jgi:hypothetical protein